MLCPSYVGSCVSVHTRAAVFSLNSNIKTAQVSPSLPLRQLSASYHKCTMGCASNQCLDQGLLQTRFSINMYILVLTPVHLPHWPSFFLLIQGQCFCFLFSLFSFYSAWSLFLLRCREGLHGIFKWREKICIPYFPESLFPSLSNSLYACPFLFLSPPFFSLIFHLSLPVISFLLLSTVSSHPVSNIHIQLPCSISPTCSSLSLPWCFVFIMSLMFSHKTLFLAEPYSRH